MLIQSDSWQPPMSPVGAKIVNDKRRFLLVIGAKKSGKTLAILDKIAKHLYEVTGAHVGIIVRRTEVGRLGVWNDFIEYTLKKVWQGQAGVLQFAVAPKVLTQTKRSICSVYNHKGEVNRVTLYPVYRASEVEQLLKNTRFSFVYVNEADQFDERIFTATADQLRMEPMGVKTEDHRLVLDCNPPDEGDQHWIVRHFIDPEVKTDIWYKDYGVIWAFVQDNPWLGESDIQTLIQQYSSNKRMHARYVLGQLIPSAEGSIFANVFDEDIHVVGEVKVSRPKTEWSLLLPPRDTAEIIRGWDLGDVNHSCVFMSKRTFNGLYCYDILDDETIIEKPTSIRNFTKMVMDKSKWWEEILRRRGADMVSWRDWSDPSAFISRSMGSSGTHALEVASASGGEIRMRPVKKGPHSVQSRVSLTTRLVGDGRMAFSVLARNVINSMIGLKAVKGGKIGPIKLKHAYDAMSYGVSAEISGDLIDEINPQDGVPERGISTIRI